MSPETELAIHDHYSDLRMFKSYLWGRHVYLRSSKEDLCQVGHLGLQRLIDKVKNGRRYETWKQYDSAAQGFQTALISQQANRWMFRSDLQWDDYDKYDYSGNGYSTLEMVDSLTRLGVWLQRIKPNLFAGFILILKQQEPLLSQPHKALIRTLLFNCLSDKKKPFTPKRLVDYPWLRKMPVEWVGI